jgi:hypothetical protein
MHLMATRAKITIGVGAALAVVGLAIRLAARAIVPSINESWSPGDWLRTDSAFWEAAWSDVGVTRRGKRSRDFM